MFIISFADPFSEIKFPFLPLSFVTKSLNAKSNVFFCSYVAFSVAFAAVHHPLLFRLSFPLAFQSLPSQSRFYFLCLGHLHSPVNVDILRSFLLLLLSIWILLPYLCSQLINLSWYLLIPGLRVYPYLNVSGGHL